MLLASSLVVLIAAAKFCDDTNYCEDQAGWAVACSTISVFLTLVYVIAAFFAQGFCDKAGPWLAMFLAIWWFPGAFVITFDGPFTGTVNGSNGYFGSWASLIFAIQWFQVTGSPIGSVSFGSGSKSGGPAGTNSDGGIVVPPQTTA
mmetsp:Transcript_86420/g.176372  ORF Transcript_86420/g.176372 Transcript_86420/m.176372 type:complete len:146 (-) Transcript_86420:236-673(-)